MTPAGTFSLSVLGAVLLSLPAFLAAANGDLSIEGALLRYLAALLLCRIGIGSFNRLLGGYVAAVEASEADEEDDDDTADIALEERRADQPAASTTPASQEISVNPPVEGTSALPEAPSDGGSVSVSEGSSR